MNSTPRVNDPVTEIVTWIGLVATLVLLLAHAVEYLFLTDGAFISFRYAVDLTHGAGLATPPGLPPVEGYPNLPWVILLSGFHRVGISPEIAAHILSLGLTVVLWTLVVWYVMRRNRDSRPWLVMLPLLFLAATRSVAVWSSGGLGTRLFEVLVVGAILRLIVELEQALESATPLRPWSAVLFALATLARPDGLPIACGAFGAAGLWIIVRRRTVPRWWIVRGAIYGAIVGAQFLFRRTYYGHWLPAPYHAEVGGGSSWDVGAHYLAAFLIEYAAYLWVPLLLAAIVYHIRKSSPWIPALIFAAIVPHALYVVSLGGDPFEFRPFDFYFPLIFLLIYDGACGLARGPRRSIAVGLWSVVILWGLVAIPLQSRLQFPDRYMNGFPGLPTTTAARYLAPERDPIYRLPVLRNVARTHQRLLRSITLSQAGLRQEEHAAFVETVVREGRELNRLAADGTLPPDTRIAIDDVGAIAYYSGLPVLDRRGLTDRELARSDPRTGVQNRLTRFDQARAESVDLWAIGSSHLVYRVDDPEFVRALWRARQQRADAYFADLGQGLFLLGRLPQGPEEAAERLPAIGLIPIGEMEAVAPIFERALRGFRAGVEAEPGNMNLRFASGEVLTWLGRPDEALSEYRAILEIDPRAVDAYNDFGLILLNLGHQDAALEAFDAALGFHPNNAIVSYNRALALSRSGRFDEAVASYRQALQQMPFLTEARIKLALLLVREGRLDDGLGELERVVQLQPDSAAGHVELAVILSRANRIAEAVPHYQQALRLNDRSLTALNNLAWIRATHANDALRDGQQAVLLAEAACEQTRYADPFYLTTLGVAYAEAGQFDEALRTSRRALELGADQPQLVDRVRQLMRFFESGKPYHEPPVG